MGTILCKFCVFSSSKIGVIISFYSVSFSTRMVWIVSCFHSFHTCIALSPSLAYYCVFYDVYSRPS